MKKVMVAGCFDLLHPGHLHFFKQARKHGDRLVVLLARDCNILKTKNRAPFFSELERKEMLEGLCVVDEVVLGNEEASRKYDKLLEIEPDALVLGYDQHEMAGELKTFIERNKMQVKVIELTESFEPERFKSTVLRKCLDAK
ncbi:MAG: adenylyltransferase/cytidyltransferase family protein [Candidatus Micrarchaeota archaeon]